MSHKSLLAKDILQYGSDGVKRLDKAIELYQKYVKKGGWEKVESGPKIIPGENNPRIPAIRKRLWITGELKKKSDEPLYDETLQNAVIAFQASHGLEADGVIGVGSIDAMNVSAEDRLNQLMVNRERFRNTSWPPSKYVHANIPDYQLYAVKDLNTALQMRIVVGLKKNWNTPEVQSQIKQIVLNPKWHVPTNIIKKELLKKIRKEPDYLTKENMKVYERKDGESVEIDPTTYDWANAKPGNLEIVQDSGDGNALGKMKFLFPNPYDIYMHDTSQKSFFANQMRSASHGCVRVQKPMELAKFLIEGSKWNEQKIKDLIDKKETYFLTLQEPVDVFIDYYTAWVDEDGTIQFRQDIYKKDISEKSL
ncbi:MAG: L,D-transpeptidase family protein [Deltaproteobacteria bacterium]|nr:MAG: L,D-transpeptidase family protein [Deltaproteobacteria bacterium]